MIALKARRPNPLRLDPSRTGSYRRILERQIVSRMRMIQREVTKLIVADDVFGLREPQAPTFNIEAASTQVNIDDPTVLTQVQRIQNTVDLKDVVKYESQPHITIRYGLDDVGSDKVAWISSQYSSILASLGGLSLFFEPKHDVLKIDVSSEDLKQINRHLGIIPNQQTHPNYIPHLTIAYLKPGTGHKYIGRSGLEGMELLFKSMVYSDLNRDHTELILNVSGDLTTNGIWQFITSGEKLQEFGSWLKGLLGYTIFRKTEDVVSGDTDSWLEQHIDKVFKAGMIKQFEYMQKPANAQSLDFYLGSKEQFLMSAFSRPPAVERVKLLASRAFNELKGVTDHMATQMQRTLTDSFIQGDSPFVMARKLNKDVADIGIKRAKVIARTETLRAHNEGALEGLEELGVEEVGVAVEWSTSGLGLTGRGNPSPCKLCAPMQGVVFTIKEAKGKLPRHPNCMCSFIPAGVGESTIGQRRTRSRIMAAVERSVKAEMPKRSKRTLAQQKNRSTWAGAKMKVAKVRPKSLLENVFCPTGKGGGVDPTCKPGSRGGISFKEFKSSAKSIGLIKLHGMSKSEKMMSTNVDGVEIRFSAKTVKVAHETLKNSDDVHPTLWKQNKAITFTSQEDTKQVAEIISGASGGDGNIVVYGGRAMTSDTLAHESGHNLAKNTWGVAYPSSLIAGTSLANKTLAAKYMKDRKSVLRGARTEITNAVTEYGKQSTAEDFAEFVTAYNEIFLQGKPSYREATKKALEKRPHSLAVVKKLLQ